MEGRSFQLSVVKLSVITVAVEGRAPSTPLELTTENRQREEPPQAHRPTGRRRSCKPEIRCNSGSPLVDPDCRGGASLAASGVRPVRLGFRDIGPSAGDAGSIPHGSYRACRTPVRTCLRPGGCNGSHAGAQNAGAPRGRGSSTSPGHLRKKFPAWQGWCPTRFQRWRGARIVPGLQLELGVVGASVVSRWRLLRQVSTQTGKAARSRAW